MTEKSESEHRDIKIQNGNYNERIEGNYIQGDLHQVNIYNRDSSKQEQNFPEICKNRKLLNEYLDNVSSRLRQKLGFINIKTNIINDHQNLKLVAIKPNFDMSIGFVQMRGEAFFIFSEFEEINLASLKAFSAQCLNYAKTKTNSSTAGSAFYNFKIPNNLCFAIALVDEIDEKTRTNVRQINPLRDKVDALWYEIPVIYELNNKQLYFYEKPLDWKDKFTGEIAWKEIRKIIKQAL
jgi:hypothetical protein